MQQQQTATLTTVFSEVLASLAFMFTDEEQQNPPPDTVWLETKISYYGSFRGTLCFRCTREFSTLLAANLLGIDSEDEQAATAAEDASKEFMNIVCGQLVTALYGTESVFNLSIPQLEVMSNPPDLYVTDDPHVSALWVEGSPVQLSYMPETKDAAQ